MPHDHDDTNETGKNGRLLPRAAMTLEVVYSQMNRFFSDYTSNISKGGTFIRTERPLKVGTEFIFQLRLPARDDPLEIKGRVAWVNSQGRKEVPEVTELGMGILFIFDGAEEKAQLQSEVETLMIDALGEDHYRGLVESMQKKQE